MIPEKVRAGGDEFLQANLTLATVTFEQRTPGFGEPHTVYRWNPAPTLFDARFDMLPAPVSFEGGFNLKGYALMNRGSTIEVQTLWDVAATPKQALGPHIWLVGNGEILATHVSLGMEFKKLRPGDTVIQRHSLAVLQRDTTLRVLVGVYRPDSGPLPIKDATGDSEEIHVLLETLSSAP